MVVGVFQRWRPPCCPLSVSCSMLCSALRRFIPWTPVTFGENDEFGEMAKGWMAGCRILKWTGRGKECTPGPTKEGRDSYTVLLERQCNKPHCSSLAPFHSPVVSQFHSIQKSEGSSRRLVYQYRIANSVAYPAGHSSIRHIDYC